MTEGVAAKHAALVGTLVEKLEAGVAPWVRPWTTTGISDLPTNAATKQHYNGTNIIGLWIAQTAVGYPTAEWMTFKQARGLGACVRKGEKGTPIFYVSKFVKEQDGEERAIPFLKAYTVFNVAQIDGLPAREIPAARPEAERMMEVEAFLTDVGARYTEGGDSAWYSSKSDTIAVPPITQYESEAAFYATLLHEHGHWTGAKHRLDRQFGKRFGDDAYAFEELVAELTAAFLCAEFAIDGKLQHAEYLGHWAKVLRAQPSALFTAGARASEAVAYLHRAAGRTTAEEAA